MASADYRLCDNCGCKTFYDSDLNYEYKDEDRNIFEINGVGQLKVLCEGCTETKKIIIVNK